MTGRTSELRRVGRLQGRNAHVRIQRNNVFGAAMKGKILVVRNSAEKDILVVNPSGANGTVTGIVTGVSGFSEPLDIAENCNGSGILYVTELGVATTSNCSGRSPADEASPRWS